MSSIEPYRNGGEVDGGEEVACGLVVARCDRAELFDLGEEIFDQVVCLVEIAIVVAGNPPIGLRRASHAVFGSVVHMVRNEQAFGEIDMVPAAEVPEDIIGILES